MLDIRRNGAYWLGVYDSWILERIRISDWLPEGGVAWDCGAFVGYYSAIFRRVVGDRGRSQAGFGPYSNKAKLEKNAESLCNTMVCLPAERVRERERLTAGSRVR